MTAVLCSDGHICVFVMLLQLRTIAQGACYIVHMSCRPCQGVCAGAASAVSWRVHRRSCGRGGCLSEMHSEAHVRFCYFVDVQAPTGHNNLLTSGLHIACLALVVFTFAMSLSSQHTLCALGMYTYCSPETTFNAGTQHQAKASSSLTASLHQRPRSSRCMMQV